jgi:hypothetical protein
MLCGWRLNIYLKKGDKNIFSFQKGIVSSLSLAVKSLTKVGEMEMDQNENLDRHLFFFLG